VIHVQCEHCGARLKVPDEHASKSGRCPKCKGRLAVPSALGFEPHVAPEPKAAATTSPAKPLDQQFLNLPKPASADDRSLEDRTRELEAMAKLGFTRRPESAGERRFAWPIDILLYPANTAGIGAMVIVIGIPSVLDLLMRSAGPLAAFVGLPILIIEFLIGLYAIRYFAECVYDSATGGVRAPMALDIDTSFTELRSQVLDLAAVYILFIGPAVFYSMWVQQLDIVFGGLVAWAVVFFPMGLLAMVIQDSASALNPFSLLVAIFRTFFPYVGLLILIGLFAGLYWLLSTLLTAESCTGWFLGVIGGIVTPYLGLVVAHVLGRFYWRYRDRLDWGL
jgi:hypothetical protein